MYDVSFFENEIELIKDKGLRKLTHRAFEKAPVYFWTAPASSTGKHHPPDSNGVGGLCRHSLKVCWLDVCFARAWERPFDIHRVASLTHDITKFGTGDKMETGKNRPQYQNHAEIAAKWLWELFDFTDNNPDTLFLRNQWSIVCDCVLTHMGRWGKIPPITIDQQILHLADMAAAEKRLVGVDFTGIVDNRPHVSGLPVHNDDEDRYFVKNADGTLVWNVGKKHWGKTPARILEDDPAYLDWLLKQDFPQAVKDRFGGIAGKDRPIGVLPNLEGI